LFQPPAGHIRRFISDRSGYEFHLQIPDTNRSYNFLFKGVPVQLALVRPIVVPQPMPLRCRYALYKTMAFVENLPIAAIPSAYRSFIGMNPISMQSGKIERVVTSLSSHSSARVEKLRVRNHPPKAVAGWPVSQGNMTLVTGKSTA
jgi:hypothetical protein